MRDLYYSKGLEVWKSPVRTIVDGGVSVSLGFHACTASDVIGEEGAVAIAALLSLAEAAQTPSNGLKHPQYAHGISDAELVKEAITFCDDELDGYSGMEYDDDCEVACQRSNTFIRELVRRLELSVSTNAPAPHMRVEPDYCFDPDDWEFACHWTDRDQVHGHGDALTRSDPMRVCTLMKGPDNWVADVPATWDENGDPEDTEIKWFDSEADARAALTATKEGQP